MAPLFFLYYHVLILTPTSLVRNTYTLIDLGNFVEGSSKGTHSGYIQLLPLTTPSTAQTDFINVRLGGDTAAFSSTQYTLLPKSEGKSSPVSSAEKKAILAEKVLGRWPYILVGCLVGTVAVVGYVCWRCCCKRKFEERKKAKAAAAAAAGGAGGVGAAAAAAKLGGGGGSGSRGSGLRGAGKRLSQSLQMNTLRSPASYQQLEDPSPSSSSYSPGAGAGGYGQAPPHSPNTYSQPLHYQQQQQQQGGYESQHGGQQYGGQYGQESYSYSSQSLVSPHPYSAQEPPSYFNYGSDSNGNINNSNINNGNGGHSPGGYGQTYHA